MSLDRDLYRKIEELHIHRPDQAPIVTYNDAIQDVLDLMRIHYAGAEIDQPVAYSEELRAKMANAAIAGLCEHVGLPYPIRESAHRWSIERHPNGKDLLVCENCHHRSESCRWERWVPERELGIDLWKLAKYLHDFEAEVDSHGVIIREWETQSQGVRNAYHTAAKDCIENTHIEG